MSEEKRLMAVVDGYELAVQAMAAREKYCRRVSRMDSTPPLTREEFDLEAAFLGQWRRKFQECVDGLNYLDEIADCGGGDGVGPCERCRL